MTTQEQKLKKLIELKEEPYLVIFDELQELNKSIKDVIDSVNNSKADKVEVTNIPEFNIDLSVFDDKLSSLQNEISNVSKNIQSIKTVDLSGIENLLSKISDKKENIDFKELSSISSILDSILYAIQNVAQSVAIKPEDNTKKLIPELSKIKDILNVLNENVISINTPEFNYKEFERIIKDNLDIKVSGGGGTNTAIIEAKLDTLNAKDFATQTTLTQIKAKTDNLDTALSGIKTGTDKIISAPATSAKQDDIITKIGDSLQGYKLYAMDTADATYTYFAYENKDANWYIKRMNNSTLLFDFATGTSDVATAYTNRSSQSYGLFSTKF